MELKEVSSAKSKTSKTVIASHLPKDISTKDVREFFSDIGPVKKCFLIRDQGTFGGVAYISYMVPEDATKAAKELNAKVLNGSQVTVKFSHPRESSQPKESLVINKGETPHLYFKRQSTSEKNSKKGRLIIRNLSFNITEDKLKAVFEEHGEVVEVVLLKKPDGSSKGVAFIQFSCSTSAAKAMAECNLKVVYGRKMAVDIAIPKKKYRLSLKHQNVENPFKKEADESLTAPESEKEDIEDDLPDDATNLEIPSPESLNSKPQKQIKDFSSNSAPKIKSDGKKNQNHNRKMQPLTTKNKRPFKKKPFVGNSNKFSNKKRIYKPGFRKGTMLSKKPKKNRKK